MADYELVLREADGWFEIAEFPTLEPGRLYRTKVDVLDYVDEALRDYGGDGTAFDVYEHEDLMEFLGAEAERVTFVLSYADLTGTLWAHVWAKVDPERMAEFREQMELDEGEEDD